MKQIIPYHTFSILPPFFFLKRWPDSDALHDAERHEKSNKAWAAGAHKRERNAHDWHKADRRTDIERYVEQYQARGAEAYEFTKVAFYYEPDI